MTKLPPLTKVRDVGGAEFERLMNQLLLAYADQQGFEYEPQGGKGGDNGIDGLARHGGVRGLKGPVAFQAKWLSGNLSKGANATQIKNSLQTAAATREPFSHYIIVTPEDITPEQKKWLLNLPKELGLRKKLKIHHWGHERLQTLFRLRPDLLAEYYPQTVKSTATDDTRKRVLSAYLAWLVRDCAPLKLRAIDQGAARSGREPLGLTSVYVDLNLDLRIPKELPLARFLQLGAKASSSIDVLAKDHELRPVPVLEALGHHPRLVLVGAPGSGKSTLTAYLALSLAEAVQGRKKSLARLGPWWKAGALPPVRVVLREFAASLPSDLRKGRAQNLWGFIAAELERCGLPRETADALRQIAADSGVLFLLDGLDEAREAATRARVLEAVTEFAPAAGDKCRFLLTTRPYAWEQAASAQSDWPAFYRLADFSREQIESFIGHWFQAVQDVGWIGKSEADEKTANLRQAVRLVGIEPLASNPLLLTLMATLLANRMRLPDDRADLYDEVVKLLLQRWSETSGADRGLLAALAIPNLKLDHIREVMQQLAFEAHAACVGREGVANIAEGDLLAALRLLLGNDVAKADLALDYIEKRAGLLLGQGPRGRQRQYTFPHRTFQEYLAACWLADQPDFCQRAVDLAHRDPAHWREVLTFAARQAKVGRGVPAADALVYCQSVQEWSKNHQPQEGDWRAAVLAAEQLLEIGLAAVGLQEGHSAVRRRVAGWLGRLLEQGALPVTERAKAGIVLGRLGDERPGVGLKDGVPEIDWIELPPGPFLMGEGKERFTCKLLTRPYRISRYPVTVAQFQAFVDAGGYREERFWTKAGWKWNRSEPVGPPPGWYRPEGYKAVFQTPNHPRVGVSWYESLAFCSWLSERLKSAVTLPSEPEWERAARHTDGRKYPWGNEHEAMQRCNMAETGIVHTSAVGMFPTGRAACGAEDMAGNVWEWTRSQWGKDWQKPNFGYPYTLDGKREDLEAPNDVLRVLRGGSWSYDASNARCAYRGWNLPHNRHDFLGFRVVASPFLCSEL